MSVAFTSLIAAVAGVLGLVFGRWWDAKSEGKRWMRDHRVRTCQEVTAEFYRIREAIRDLSMCERDTSPWRDTVREVHQVGAKWNSAVAALWLHAPQPVAIETRRLDDAINELFLAARDGGPWTRAEFRENRKPAQEALDAFINSVRRELSFGRHDIPRHWTSSARDTS